MLKGYMVMEAAKFLALVLALVICASVAQADPSMLSGPEKLAYTDNLNGRPILFIADSAHQQIQMMTLDGAIIDTIGSGKRGHDDNSFEKASFDMPRGIIYHDTMLYIADSNNHLLRVADLKTRMVTTLAGTGVRGNRLQTQNTPALHTPMAFPWDVAFYPDENHIAIAMPGLHQIWSYDVIAKTLSVIAKNGQQTSVDGPSPANALVQPSGLSTFGSKLYFVDTKTNSLRVLEDGIVRTLISSNSPDAGFKDGVQGTARMQHPSGVYADQSGIYVTDSSNHSIRRYDPSNGGLFTIAGNGMRGSADGTGAAASFNEPSAMLRVGDTFYIADTGNNAIRAMDYNGNTATVNVTLPTKQTAVEIADELPNVQKLPLSDIGTDGATLTLQLQDGWHINPDAPSSIALFDITDSPKTLASFTSDIIQHRQFSLPKVEADKNYRLQAMLNFCQDLGVQCVIKSFDQPLIGKVGGQMTLLLKLN